MHLQAAGTGIEQFDPFQQWPPDWSNAECRFDSLVRSSTFRAPRPVMTSITLSAKTKTPHEALVY